MTLCLTIHKKQMQIKSNTRTTFLSIIYFWETDLVTIKRDFKQKSVYKQSGGPHWAIFRHWAIDSFG
jgi:hypothetical protein